MYKRQRFDDADVETERGVILEEIGMYEDNPEDLCAERLAGAVFKGSPLARPILGRKATLDKICLLYTSRRLQRHGHKMTARRPVRPTCANTSCA